MKLIYKCLTVLFYFIGDILSKSPIQTDLICYLYQKAMSASVFFDDKAGPYWWWKLP